MIAGVPELTAAEFEALGSTTPRAARAAALELLEYLVGLGAGEDLSNTATSCRGWRRS